MSAVVPLGGLIPAVAIIDSRNLAGQAEEVLGARRYPGVSGVRQALELYGFAVGKVIAAVGTRASGSSSRLSAALTLNQDFAARFRNEGGEILEGYLRDSYNKMEEKQVDVLCARAIADEAYASRHEASPSKAIVLISKDSDLTPMFSFAKRLGVPVYAAATSGVDRRGDIDWILLGEAAIRIMTAARGSWGHDVRDQVSALAFLQWGKPYRWSVTGVVRRKGQDVVKLRHRTGIYGSALIQEFGGIKPAKATKHDLYPIGVDLGERGREFPLVMLSKSGVGGCASNLREAVVAERVSPTQVTLRLNDGDKLFRVEATIDNMHLNRRVLVQREGSDTVRWVGGLEPCATYPTEGDPTMPTIVEIASLTGTPLAIARRADGTTMPIRLPRGEVGRVGSRYVGIAAGLDQRLGSHLIAISSSLC
ncbi:hypothetical protein [Acrocarpospora sp. B8E8]|uniref:hypothetical protein n=1 Tax=Acrocarpospora sp. B8E8 TaxID=3153572 RepID=UPI00325ED753